MSTKNAKKKTAARQQAPKVTRTDNPTAARAGVTRRKPKTAFQLLAGVAKHIEAEPRRYVQSTWLERGRNAIREMYGVRPPCGTVACRAGWIVVLHDGMDGAVKLNARPDPFQIADRANAILGMDDRATGDLFNGYCLAARGLKVGTAEYAQRGAAGIRAFMAEHEAHLKARLLKDVPKVSA